MSVRHLPRLDPERWYVIDIDRTDGAAPWRHRGLWLHGPNVEAHAEWNLLCRGHGVGFQFGRNGGESDIGLNLYAGPIGSLWLRLRAPFTRWARVDKARDEKYWYEARHTGIRFCSYRGSIVLVELDSHDNGGPKRELKLSAYQLLGRSKFETVDGDSGVANVPLPEGNYIGVWTEKISTRAYVGRRLGRIRDAMFGPRVHRYIDLTIEGGIPVEGKGENSWDCGMDGLFGTGGATLEKAIANAVEHVLRDRRRYGGPNALPRPMTVTEAATTPPES